MNRQLATAARRFADANSERIATATGGSQIIATIADVTPGAASDGNALVAISWRGATLTVAGYAASYTPAVGHRVVCDYIDNQLIVAYRIIGQP